MLTSLRRRQSTMQQRRDQRRTGPRWTPYIYVGVLLTLALWAGNNLFGHMFFLRADGLVVATATAVSSENVARVDAVHVEQGQRVQRDAPVVDLSSQSYAEKIATLTLRRAQNASQLAELRARRDSLPELMAAATARTEAAGERLKSLSELAEQNIVTESEVAAAHDRYYRALAERRSLESDQQTISQRIDDLRTAVEAADETIATLKQRYGSGRISAPADGIVGQVSVSPGDVVQPGQSMLRIYREPRFVLGFLPATAFYDIRPGDRVEVRYGLIALPATIEKVEPVAPELPEEFQKSFKPVDRQQLAYIRLADPAAAPPLFAKVELRSGISEWERLRTLLGLDR